MEKIFSILDNRIIKVFHFFPVHGYVNTYVYLRNERPNPLIKEISQRTLGKYTEDQIAQAINEWEEKNGKINYIFV